MARASAGPSSVSSTTITDSVTAAASTTLEAAHIDPHSGLPFYVVEGESTWDHPTRPVVASVLTAIRAVRSLKDHERDLQNRARKEENSEEEEEDSEEEDSDHPDDASDVIDPDGELDEETREEIREDQRAERRGSRELSRNESNEPYRQLDPAFDSYPKYKGGYPNCLSDTHDEYGERRTRRHSRCWVDTGRVSTSRHREPGRDHRSTQRHSASTPC